MEHTFLLVRLTKEQKETLKEQAKIEGLTMKTYILKHCGVL